MAKLTDIKGIDEAIAEKLAQAGATNSARLLELGGSAAGRRQLAAAAGLDGSQLLKWVNRADLDRISGVAGVYADLLEIAGVDTVKELATRRPDNLHTRLLEINAAQSLTKRPPTTNDVEKWVTEAKQLPAMITH
jgi:predicted flap endonuclease-1-like 5' DNA nuclease